MGQLFSCVKQVKDEKDASTRNDDLIHEKDLERRNITYLQKYKDDDKLRKDKFDSTLDFDEFCAMFNEDEAKKTIKCRFIDESKEAIKAQRAIAIDLTQVPLPPISINWPQQNQTNQLMQGRRRDVARDRERQN